jgi:hypothetical protein
VIRNLLKPIVTFITEKTARDVSLYEAAIQKSIELVTVSSLPDETMGMYLFEQCQAILRIRIWLLNQNHQVQGKTYATATDLQGTELKSACLAHLKEAQDLLVQVQGVFAVGGRFLKVHTGLLEVSSRAFLSLQFDGFVFDPKSLEWKIRLKS